MKFMRFFKDQSASTTVDFAFALPVLLTIMLGTFQLGQYLHASGAMRHALGEGIRYAKVHSSADSDAIKAEVLSEMATLDPDNVVGFSFVRGTSNGVQYGAVVMKYKLEAMMPLVPVPDITITETKVAYIPA